MFDNIIFDWSGTLVDDLGPVLEATNCVFERFGVEKLDREGFRRRFRLPYREFYEEVLPAIPLAELEGHFRKAFAAALTPVTVLPHAREKLEWCAREGIRAFVLTSMDEAAFHEQLERFGFGRFFEATYAGVLDKREMIHRILTDHQLDPAATVFVGDMTHDIETARHGGIASVAVLTGYQHSEVLAAVRPDLTVPDLQVLRELLGRARTSRTGGNGLPPDVIEIRGLELPVHIGVPAEERARPQTLRATIRMELPSRFEHLADDIRRTVDYEQAALAVRQLAAERPRQLIETLAAELANHLLATYPVAQVEVVLEKKILPQTDCVAVRVVRRR